MKELTKETAKLIAGLSGRSEGSSLKDKIYFELFQSIISGEIGNDVISEKVVAEKYKVSRAPVREALVQLCGDGVIYSMPRYGYQVVQLTKGDIEDILNYRVVLEGGSFKEHVHSITDREIAELEKINELCTSEEAQSDFWVHWMYNVQFHLKLMSFCGNRFSFEMLERAMQTLTRAYAQFYWDRWNKDVFPKDTRFHDDIIGCLKKKDIEGAIHFLKEDISDFGR